MNKSVSGEFSSGSDAAADAPTPEQAAILRYLGLAPVEETTQTQAAALISQSEADPAGQEKLQAWHRDKYRLHPDLFAPPQRPFREARWWQAKISDDSLYGYSFQQPSLNQTFVILEALDRQEPGWDQEGGKRREARFMNELATLSPELCKPGCAFPHELPIDDGSEASPASPTARPNFTPPTTSTLFVPGQYAASSLPIPPTSQPAWQPPVQPPTQALAPLRAVGDAPETKGGGAWKWLLLAALLAAGGGAYFFFGFHPPALERGAGAKSSAAGSSASSSSANPSTAVAANASRQRAIAKYPDLARAGSALNAKFVVTFRELDSAHDPLLQQPDWPEQLAARCANALSPSPAGSKNRPTPSPAPAGNPQAAATAPAAVPTLAAASAPATAASSTPLPLEAMFVSLEASYKSKVNTVKYAQHGDSQRAAVVVDIRSMMRVNVKFVLRCVFFKRPNGRGDLRVVLSSEQKRFELAAGQAYADAFDSPPVYRGPHATEEFDGWLVQLTPEGSDKFLKQIGSTGTIEELGKQMKF